MVFRSGEQWSEIVGRGAAGDLSVTSYAVLLAGLARSKRTCTLHLVRKPVTKEVVFVDGRPLECRSNLAHEMLGRFLLSEGKLSPKEHHGALSDSVSSELPLGEILIRRGLLSPQEVYRFLQKNLARKLLDGFTWNRGEYVIAAGGEAPDGTVKVNAPQLILTGVLKLTPQAEITVGVERYAGRPLGLDPDADLEGRQLRLTGNAATIVEALRSKEMTLEELPAAVSLATEDVQRSVYALALLEQVAPQDEISTREPRSARAPTDEPVAEAASTVASDTKKPEDDQALLLRQTKIVEAYLSFRRKDSFELLELEEDCAVAEIEKAFLEAAETYAPWSLGGVGATDFTEQAEVLFLKAAQAYAELRKSESRGALVHRRGVLRESERKKAKYSIKTDLLDSEEQFKGGLALAEKGELGKALELLEFAADCDPQSAIYRAELAYRRDQFESHRYRKQSIRDLREAIRIDANCGVAHYYLGLILNSEGDSEGAESSLRRSIKLMAPDRRPIDALRDLSSRKKR